VAKKVYEFALAMQPLKMQGGRLHGVAGRYPVADYGPSTPRNMSSDSTGRTMM
jgi:hypothetical protein